MTFLVLFLDAEEEAIVCVKTRAECSMGREIWCSHKSSVVCASEYKTYSDLKNF